MSGEFEQMALECSAMFSDVSYLLFISTYTNTQLQESKNGGLQL